MKTLCFVAAVIFFQVLDFGSKVALTAAENNRANQQGSDAKYASTSPVADYISRVNNPYQDEMRVLQPSAMPDVFRWGYEWVTNPTCDSSPQANSLC